jgi:hypothetical protein
MQKTPQEFKRENVKKLFQKILKEEQLIFDPVNVSVSESQEDKHTSISFSFEMHSGTKEIVELSCNADGFVDGLFTACYSYFCDSYNSLKNIRLLDYQVKPNMKKSKNSLGTDAKVEVSVIMDVQNHGIAEFNSCSRSVLRSSFASVLRAFEFYINCEKAFHKIQTFIADAKKRNRGDIISSCTYDLTTLTEVNNYDQETRH